MCYYKIGGKVESSQNKLFTVFHGIQSLWWSNYTIIKQDLLSGVVLDHKDSITQVLSLLTQLHNHIIFHDKDAFNPENLGEIKTSPLAETEKKVMVLTSGSPIMRDKTEIPFFPDEEWEIKLKYKNGDIVIAEGDRFELIRFFDKEHSEIHSISLKISKTGELRKNYEQKLRHRLIEERTSFIDYIKNYIQKNEDSKGIIQKCLKDFNIPSDPKDIHFSSLDLESLNDLRDNLSIISSGLTKNPEGPSQRVHQEWTKLLADTWKIWTNKTSEPI